MVVTTGRHTHLPHTFCCRGEPAIHPVKSAKPAIVARSAPCHPPAWHTAPHRTSSRLTDAGRSMYHRRCERLHQRRGLRESLDRIQDQRYVIEVRMEAHLEYRCA